MSELNVNNAQVNANQDINNVANPAPNAPLAPAVKQAIDDGFVLFENNGEVMASEDQSYTSSLTMNKKFQSIRESVKQVAEGSRDMKLSDLMKALVDYSENDYKNKNEMVLFRDAKGSVALDQFALEMIKKLISSYCFQNRVNLTDDEQKLKSDLENALTTIMDGKYKAKGREGMMRTLNQAIEQLCASVNASNNPKKAQALALLDEVKTKFNNIITNRHVAGLNMYQALKSKNTVAFKNAEALIGMGSLFSKYDDELSKIVKIPKVDANTLKNQIISGEKTVKEAMGESPESKSALLSISQQGLSKLKSDLKKLDDATADLNTEKQTIMDDIVAKGANHEEVNAAVNAYTQDILERIKDLHLINNDADNLLTDQDKDTLYAGADKDHDSRVAAEVAKLRDLLKAFTPKMATSLDKFAQKPQLLLHVLKTIDFSPTLLLEFLAEPSISGSLCNLENPNLSDADFRACLNNLSSHVYDSCNSAENSLLAQLLSGVDTSQMSATKKIILDNLPIKLELTKDALISINYILHGDANVDSALDIDFGNLKAAFQKVCNPTAELKQVLADHNCTDDLKTVENMLIKAAYHQFLSDHPNEPECQKPFASNTRFLSAMGLTSTGEAGKIDIIRYKGFDPTHVNLNNTEVSTFLSSFNIMMNHSDFVESCGKLPPVHLANRLVQALDLNILEFLDSTHDLYLSESQRDGVDKEQLRQELDPGLIRVLRTSYSNLTTSQEKIKWYNDNMQHLTSLFINSHKMSFNDIASNNQHFDEKNKVILKNLHIDDIIQFYQQSSQAVGSQVEPLTTADHLFQDLDKIQGSQDMAFFASIVDQIATRDVFDVLSGGREFLGLKAEDFLNTANLDKIKNALKGAPVELRETSDFKFAFLSFVQLKNQAAIHGNEAQVKAEVISSTLISKAQIRAATQLISPNEVRELPNGFSIVDGDDVYTDKLVDFCIYQRTLTDADRLKTLQQLQVTDGMFKPKNNIFITNEKSAEKTRDNITSALNQAIDALKNPANDARKCIKDLKNTIFRNLAGDKTHSIVNGLVYLSTFMDTEYKGDTVTSFNTFMAEKYASFFKTGSDQDNTIVAKTIKSMLNVTGQTAQIAYTMLSSESELSDLDDEMVAELIKNPLVMIMADKAMRDVAYNNKCETLADFKYSFSSGKTINGKSRKQIMAEVLASLRKDLMVDTNILEKMVRSITESSRYLKNTVTTRRRAKRSLRRLGRVIRSSRFVSKVSRTVTSAVGWAKSILRIGGKHKMLFAAQATAVITNLEVDKTLVYTKENTLSIEAGKNLEIKGVEIGATLGVNINAGSNLEIEHTSDGGYVFTMSAALGGKLGLTAGVGTANDTIFRGKFSAGGGYQRGIAVVFNSEAKAIEFLSKIMAANVEMTDLQRSSELRAHSVESFDFNFGVEANIAPTINYFKGVEDDSDKNVVNVAAEAEFGQAREWKQETGTNSVTFSRSVATSASFGVSAEFSLTNAVMGSVDKDKLSAEEKAQYKSKKETLSGVDKLYGIFKNPTKFVNSTYTDALVTMASGHEYTDDEKKAWSEMDDFQRFNSNPDRYIAQSTIAFANQFTNEAVADVLTLTDYILKKFPGVKATAAFVNRIVAAINSLNTLVNKLDTSSLRFDFDFKFGDKFGEFATVSAGLNYDCNTTTSYETNLLQNDLRKVELTTTIEPEKKGSAKTRINNNVSFLTKTMKSQGFTKEQINKVISQLDILHNKGVNIENFEIVRTAKKDAIAKIKRTIRTDRNIAKQINKQVGKMADADFQPVKVVINTTRNIAKTSTGISAGALVKVAVGSKEALSKTQAYEVTF